MTTCCVNIQRLLNFSIRSAQLKSIRIGRSYSSYSKENLGLEFEEARSWFSKFKRPSIPTKIAKTTFSRASGPGGQKTNKTSSKATTIWPISSLFTYLPKVLHQEMRKSRYYVTSSESILIQSDSHRGQSSNEDETHQKLFNEIVRIYQETVPGVTSLEQKNRVVHLKKAEKAKRLRDKKQHSVKKSLRRGASE